MIYFLDPICIMRRPRRVTPETAIFEGLETLLRLARDARAGGGEQDQQDPVAVAGSVVGVLCWGATPVWSRAGTGKGRFEEAGDKACKSLDLALRLALEWLSAWSFDRLFQFHPALSFSLTQGSSTPGR